MKNMIISIAVLLGLAALVIWSCCKMSGDCDRREDQ